MSDPTYYRLQGSPVFIGVAGIVAVAVDMTLFRLYPQEAVGFPLRSLAAVAMFVLLLATRQATFADLGLALTSWRNDLKWAAKVCTIVLLATLVFSAGFVLTVRLGWVDPNAVNAFLDFRNAEELRRYLLMGLIGYPILEELVYRGLAA
jgi:hypothetical protein